MIKSPVLWALILISAGCRGEPVAPEVSYLQTRIDESQNPLPFVVRLHNHSDSAIDVTGVTVDLLGAVRVPSSQGSLKNVTAADLAIEMLPGHPTQIAPASDGVACGFVRWHQERAESPATAIVTLVFRVTLSNGQSIVTPASTLLLREPATTAVDQIVASLRPDEIPGLLESVSAISGSRTDQVEQLIEELRKQTNVTAIDAANSTLSESERLKLDRADE